MRANHRSTTRYQTSTERTSVKLSKDMTDSKTVTQMKRSNYCLKSLSRQCRQVKTTGGTTPAGQRSSDLALSEVEMLDGDSCGGFVDELTTPAKTAGMNTVQIQRC